MPMSKYDPEFGGKQGAAEEAHANMIKEYGAKKGEKVFYATKNKRKKKMKAHAQAVALGG